jgi:hypothetical protein
MRRQSVLTQIKNWLNRPLISVRGVFFWSLLTVVYYQFWAGYSALPGYAWLKTTGWQIAMTVGLPLLMAAVAAIDGEILRRRRGP